MAFTHLRTTSANSVNKGLLSVKQIINLAKQNNQTAVAITDDSKTIGVIEHYMKAREQGLKPIIGADVYIESDVTMGVGADVHKVLLLATNNASYKNLMKLISKGYIENQSNGNSVIKESWFLEDDNAKGLICLSGTFKNSLVAQRTIEVIQEKDKDLKKTKYLELQKIVEFYKNTFKDNYYFELQRIGEHLEDEVILAYLQQSKINNIPLVATNPVEFGKREDFVSNEIRMCDVYSSVKGKMTLLDVDREAFTSTEQYFKTTEEMKELFKGLEFALENTQTIVDKCNVEIELHHNYLPPFPVPTQETEVEYFKRLTKEGFERIMRKIFPNEEDYKANYKKYHDRLTTEINCIIKMEFPGYFLIVQDFIQWAKNNEVPVGPGRGSGAGSLVAYSLGITDVDPIKYELLFERFLNPERVSMPDFDIDFAKDSDNAKDGRSKVIQYVTQKYGSEYVSQILALQNLKAKALLKMVGRTLNLPNKPIEELAKTIVDDKENSKTIEEIYESNEDFRRVVDDNPVLGDLYNYSKTMEVIPKSMSQHAAGVIITSKPLTEFASLYTEANSPVIIQLDKVYSEYAGLVKFDFLGIKTLNIINETIKDVAKFKGEKIDISSINLDDPDVISNIFKTGNTVGVFQFDGAGMQKFIKQINPDNFEEISAATALYRPGPMQSGMKDSFISRKHGEEAISFPEKDYQHSCLEPVLKNTFGLFVYQEQVMQAAQAMAGYSLGEADLLRRAMGKKKPEEMEKQRVFFKKGALKNGISEELSMKIFDIIEKFAGYGFNKSHSVAYTVLSMQCAYLKLHHPEYFLCNSFNFVDGQKPEIERSRLIDDFKKQGIEVISPDINKSKGLMTIQEGKAVYGLSCIKNVGTLMVEQMIEERERNGEFKSFIDFYERCGDFIGKKAVQQFIKAGAFEKINSNQNELLANLENFDKLAKKIKTQKAKDTKNTLNTLLTGKKATKKSASLPSYQDIEWKTMPETTDLEKTTNELQSIGFNLINDPLMANLADFDGMKALNTVIEVQDFDTDEENYKPMSFAGYITFVKGHSSGGMQVEVIGEGEREDSTQEDLKNKFLDENDNLLDEVESDNEQDNEVEEDYQNKRVYRFFIGKDVVAKHRKKLKQNSFVVFEGTVSKSKKPEYGKNSFWTSEIYDKEDMEERLTNEVNILVNPKNPKDILPILEKHHGRIPVTLYIPSKTKGELLEARVDKKYFVNASRDCLSELREVLGKEAIKLGFKEKLILETNNQKRFIKR